MHHNLQFNLAELKIASAPAEIPSLAPKFNALVDAIGAVLNRKPESDDILRKFSTNDLKVVGYPEELCEIAMKYNALVDAVADMVRRSV